MTATPEPPINDPTKTKDEKDKQQKAVKELSEISPLESMFYLGYAESPVITIFDNDEVELKAKFRTLVPAELRDIAETAMMFDSGPAQVITERLETLARAIINVNHMPLVLTSKEQTEYYEQHDRQPSPLDMARTILNEKIKSMVIIDALYDAYTDFVEKTGEDIEKLKKK